MVLKLLRCATPRNVPPGVCTQARAERRRGGAGACEPRSRGDGATAAHGVENLGEKMVRGVALGNWSSRELRQRSAQEGRLGRRHTPTAELNVEAPGRSESEGTGYEVERSKVDGPRAYIAASG